MSRPTLVTAEVQLKKPMADGDYTHHFLEAGTTLNVSGQGWEIDGPVPVTRAWVEAGVLRVEGRIVL